MHTLRRLIPDSSPITGMSVACLLLTLLLLGQSCGTGRGNDAGSDSISSHDSIPTQQPQNLNEDPFEDETDSPTPLRSNLGQFLLEGYELRDTFPGDLNRDAFPDMAMVINLIGSDDISDSIRDAPRPLLLLLGQKDLTYLLAARNDSAIFSYDYGGPLGDPFVQVVIKDGYFSIEHYGGSSWRWSRTTTFKYSAEQRAWFLHKDGGETFNTSTLESSDEYLKTTRDFGVVPFVGFDIYESKD